MIPRKQFEQDLHDNMSVFPICAVLGPRQVGKTTLARLMQRSFRRSVLFDLEDPRDFERFQDLKRALDVSADLIVIDEVQRLPALFPYLRVYIDNHPEKRLLVLGGSSPDLLRQCGESLAGRIGYLELTPFSLNEVNDMPTLWFRGGYPKAYLATSSVQSDLWIKNYVTSFLERDLASLGFGADAYIMRKLWMMIAHYHGNLVNYTDLGRSLEISSPIIKKYLTILEKTFMLRILMPWHENIKKRQIKQPKVYIRDTGILHYLLGLTEADFSFHPKIGASWEGFALEEVIRCHRASAQECYFWRTQDGAELDLLIVQPGRKIGFEFKLSDRVSMTPSMRVAMADLGLDQLLVITPTLKTPYSLADGVMAMSLAEYMKTAFGLTNSSV